MGTATPACTHRLKVRIKGNGRQTVISLEEMHTRSLGGSCSGASVLVAHRLSALLQHTPVDRHEESLGHLHPAATVYPDSQRGGCGSKGISSQQEDLDSIQIQSWRGDR